MNKIYQLFDEQFVTNLFRKEVLPLYPDYTDVRRVEIKPAKRNIWETTYHVVIQFCVSFLAKDDQIKQKLIYCSAHSSEPRQNSYKALNFLWQNSFSRGHLTIPRPLFYSSYFNGFFYRGVAGNNLYYYIRNNNRPEIESIIARTAAWFAKLHQLPANQAENFNPENSRIITVIPGMAVILDKIKHHHPRYYAAYKLIQEIINNQETAFFKKYNRFWLIHGDAHPENVIKVSQEKIAVIDFTDMCLADFARDLGSFLEQLEFMGQRKMTDANYIKKMQDIFLRSYLQETGIKLDAPLQSRIDLYYNWTALRTATLFLLKQNPQPERAHGLLVKICEKMKLDVRI